MPTMLRGESGTCKIGWGARKRSPQADNTQFFCTTLVGLGHFLTNNGLFQLHSARNDLFSGTHTQQQTCF